MGAPRLYTMSIAQPVPGQMIGDNVNKSGSGMTISCSETMHYHDRDYMIDAHRCCESIGLCGCPYAPWFRYSSEVDQMIFFNKCVCCCQDWKVEMVPQGKDRGEGHVMGGTATPGCCDNGCFFCMCPFLTCGGNIVLQNMYKGHDSAAVFYTLRRKLCCCWVCPAMCGCCGICGQTCGDCCARCQDQNNVLTVEKIYPNVQTMDKDTDLDTAPHYGRLVMADRIDCVGCCPWRTPLKYTAILDETGGSLDDEMVPVVGTLVQLWKGAPVPCSCCALPPTGRPSGVSCIDLGRQVQMKRCTTQEMLKFTNAKDPHTLATLIDAEFGDSNVARAPIHSAVQGHQVPTQMAPGGSGHPQGAQFQTAVGANPGQA